MEITEEKIIKVENVDLWYDVGKPMEVHALKNIDISIKKGDYVAFFGPSGCGKTTLLYAITGIDAFQSGRVLINDKKLNLDYDTAIAINLKRNKGLKDIEL